MIKTENKEDSIYNIVPVQFWHVELTDKFWASRIANNRTVTIPNGFTDRDTPTGIALVGQIYGEEKLLTAAKALQDETSFHQRHPSL